MSGYRVGLGVDAHRFGGDPPLKLGGVVVDDSRGVEATSDGDVAAHALADALLGAAGLGDLGQHFPADDPQSLGADSMIILQDVVRMVQSAGWEIVNADLTIIAQEVRIAPHRQAISQALAEVLGVDVSVKATTTDGMGFIGRAEGLAVLAIAAVTI
jgi:2-C-methyl-D-erythritol 2,4-cyclodiphosphate synthase